MYESKGVSGTCNYYHKAIVRAHAVRLMSRNRRVAVCGLWLGRPLLGRSGRSVLLRCDCGRGIACEEVETGELAEYCDVERDVQQM